MLLTDSGTNQEAQIVQDASDGFGVADFIAANHLFDFAVRERFASNSLVVLRLGFSEGQIFSKKNVHALFEKTGRRKNVEKNVEAFRAVAGFFDQFARGGASRVFAFVDASGN